jgi:hypothetical protein
MICHCDPSLKFVDQFWVGGAVPRTAADALVSLFALPAEPGSGEVLPTGDLHPDDSRMCLALPLNSLCLMRIPTG